MNDVLDTIGIVLFVIATIILVIYIPLVWIMLIRIFFKAGYYYEEPIQLLKESGFKDLGERMEYIINRFKRHKNKPFSILNQSYPYDGKKGGGSVEFLRVVVKFLRLSIPKTEKNKELLKRQRGLKLLCKSFLMCFIGIALGLLAMFIYPDA